MSDPTRAHEMYRCLDCGAVGRITSAPELTVIPVPHRVVTGGLPDPMVGDADRSSPDADQPGSPDGTMEDALRRSSDLVSQLLRERQAMLASIAAAAVLARNTCPVCHYIHDASTLEAHPGIFEVPARGCDDAVARVLDEGPS